MKHITNVGYSFFAMILALAPAVASAQWNPDSNAESTGLSGTSIFTIIENGMNWLLAILGFLGIIGFIISGILYLTAAGDDSQVEKAKGTMVASITGVIVALLGYVILTAVTAWLGGDSTTF